MQPQEKSLWFGTANDGTAFRLKLPVAKAGLTELSISHFNNAGLGDATDAELAQLPPLESLPDQIAMISTTQSIMPPHGVNLTKTLPQFSRTG